MSSFQVKPRFDGRGDGWALEHREGLGRTFNMQDLDAVIGVAAFAQNTGEKLFIEYAPDNFRNRYNIIRNFALVGMFDRKASESAAFHKENRLSTAHYLWLCRSMSERQPVPAKFFYVCGGQEYPWTMIEIDPSTGEECGRRAVLEDGRCWYSVWEALGLVDLRWQLTRWIDP